MQRTRTHPRAFARLSKLFRTRHAPAVARVPNPPDPHRKLVLFTRRGGVKSGLLLWILGVPIPLILLFLLIKGCVT